jgi:hypothetical protein
MSTRASSTNRKQASVALAHVNQVFQLFDTLSDLILIVAVVPIFRLNRLATLLGSFFDVSSRLFANDDPIVAEGDYGAQRFFEAGTVLENFYVAFVEPRDQRVCRTEINRKINRA